MKKIAKVFGLAVLGLFAVQTAARADSAIRFAVAEVRNNGSSFATAFEQVVPDSVFFNTTAGPTLTITTTNPGTNQSDIDSVAVTGVATDTTLATLDSTGSLEAAIARAVDESVAGTATGFAEEEDIVGLVRSFVGPEGTALANPSATLD